MIDYSSYYPIIYDSISKGVDNPSIAKAIHMLNPDSKLRTLKRHVRRIRSGDVVEYQQYKADRDKVINIPDNLTGKEGLIQYLEDIKFDEIKNFPDLNWKMLSKRFGGTRSPKWAKHTWERYKNRSNVNYLPNTDLEQVKVIKKNGEVEWETYKKELNVNSDLSPKDIQDLELEAYTSNPYGGGWAKYKKPGEFTFDESDVLKLSEVVSDIDFSIKRRSGSKIGCVDIADIHVGLLHLIGVETKRKPDFNLKAVEYYLSNAVSVINSYNFEEVYLFFPGDLVESFTGKNHRDTWKHLEKFKNNIVIVIYKVLKKFISQIYNVKGLYFVDGNHDRLTAKKEGNSRQGLSEIVSFFLKEQLDCEVEYHPLMIEKEVDDIYHIMTHGDFKPWIAKVGGKKKLDYGHFLFKFGKKDKFNVLKTGHYHGNYEVLRQGSDFLHYQCPSLSTGNFFEEAIGYDHVPGISVLQNEEGLPRIDFRPFKLYTAS